MPVPDFQSLMRPLLQALANHGGETSVKELAPVVAQRLALTADDLAEMLPSGRQTTFMNRLHWAKSFMAHADLLQSTRRGHFKITAEGNDILTATREPISVKRLMQNPKFAAWQKGDSTNDVAVAAQAAVIETTTATPEEQIMAALGAIAGELKQALLERFQTASPAFFERTVVRLLEAMGFTGQTGAKAQTTGRSGDGGIDGIIHQDSLGLDAIYVQAKRYQTGSGVGRPEINAFVGAMTGESAVKGVFVTTSHFTKDARDYLQKVQQRIVLIDGERLAELALRHDIGVRTRAVLPLKSLDEDYFADDVIAAT